MTHKFLTKAIRLFLGTGVLLVATGVNVQAQTTLQDQPTLQKTAEENFQQGNLTFALQQWSREIRENKNLASALYNRAQTYILLEQDSFALKDLDQLIALQGTQNPAPVYILRGIVLSKLNQTEEAIKSFNQAERIQPSALLYNNRALAYQKLGKLKNAIKDLERSIAIEPTPLHRLNLANIKLQTGVFSDVIQDMSQVISQQPQFYPAYLSRGIAYYNRQQYQDAIRDFITSLNIMPGQAQAYYYSGLSFNALNHKQEAIDNLTKAADIYLRQNQPRFYHQILLQADEITASSP